MFKNLRRTLSIIQPTRLLVIVFLVALVVPVDFARAEQVESHRTEMLAQIEGLMTLIAELQGQLEKKLAAESKVSNQTDSDEKFVRPEIILGYDGLYESKHGLMHDGKRLNTDALVEHKELWQLFYELAGEDFVKKYVNEFWIFDDAESSSRAHVREHWVSSPSWYLAVNVDGIDIKNESDLHQIIYSYVHEYAHIISLNSVETDRFEEESDCKTYFTGSSCLDSDSYLFKYISNFWNDRDLEYAYESRDQEDYYDKLEFVTDFYNENKQEFVSLYAASDPIEDFAESFATYVLTNDEFKSDKIQDEKVAFFNEFEDLRRARYDIRTGRANYLSNYYSGN